MTEPGTFSRRQWALAAGLALALHGLLAWAWLATTPPLAPASGGDGGLRVGTLSLGAAEAPLVTAVAPEAATQTMTEVAPAPRAPTPPPKPTNAQTIEPPQPRTPPPALTERPTQAPTERPTASTNAAQKRDDQGGRAGDDSGHQGAVGADPEARPLPGNPRPVYPSMARRQGIEGRVLIRVAVLDSGQVGRAEVSRGSGARALDDAALAAVRRWRFYPALRRGQAIAATVTVPVVFRLED